MSRAGGLASSALVCVRMRVAVCASSATSTSASSPLAVCCVTVEVAGVLSPATARQWAVSPAIHAPNKGKDGDNGPREADDGVAVEDDGPEGNEQEEALPRVASGPCEQAGELVKRE